MVLQNLSTIRHDQWPLIEEVFQELSEIPRRERNYHENIVVDLFRSKNNGDYVNVIRGVHYNNFDFNGNYHFNIQLIQRGIPLATTYHVYVYPYLYEEPNPFYITEDGTVISEVASRWKYHYVRLT